MYGRRFSAGTSISARGAARAAGSEAAQSAAKTLANPLSAAASAASSVLVEEGISRAIGSTAMGSDEAMKDRKRANLDETKARSARGEKTASVELAVRKLSSLLPLGDQLVDAIDTAKAAKASPDHSYSQLVRISPTGKV